MSPSERHLKMGFLVDETVLSGTVTPEGFDKWTTRKILINEAVWFLQSKKRGAFGASAAHQSFAGESFCTYANETSRNLSANPVTFSLVRVRCVPTWLTPPQPVNP